MYRCKGNTGENAEMCVHALTGRSRLAHSIPAPRAPPGDPRPGPQINPDYGAYSATPALVTRGRHKATAATLPAGLGPGTFSLPPGGSLAPFRAAAEVPSLVGDRVKAG